MSELRKPKDYAKAIWALGIMEIIIYVRIPHAPSLFSLADTSPRRPSPVP